MDDALEAADQVWEIEGFHTSIECMGRLSDKQLEQVNGGMPAGTYSNWRANTINGDDKS